MRTYTFIQGPLDGLTVSFEGDSVFVHGVDGLYEYDSQLQTLNPEHDHYQLGWLAPRSSPLL